jgi:hypothetical protein
MSTPVSCDPVKRLVAGPQDAVRRLILIAIVRRTAASRAQNTRCIDPARLRNAIALYQQQSVYGALRPSLEILA